MLDIRVELTPTSARTGVQLLGWNRLVGVKVSENIPLPLVAPEDYGRAVQVAPDLIDTFCQMSDDWYGVVEAKRTGVDDNGAFLRFRGALWRELQKGVLCQPSNEFDVLEVMTASSHLTMLTKQTANYFFELVNADPNHPPAMGSRADFFKRYAAFEDTKRKGNAARNPHGNS